MAAAAAQLHHDPHPLPATAQNQQQRLIATVLSAKAIVYHSSSSGSGPATPP